MLCSNEVFGHFWWLISLIQRTYCFVAMIVDRFCSVLRHQLNTHMSIKNWSCTQFLVDNEILWFNRWCCLRVHTVGYEHSNTSHKIKCLLTKVQKHKSLMRCNLCPKFIEVLLSISIFKVKCVKDNPKNLSFSYKMINNQ